MHVCTHKHESGFERLLVLRHVSPKSSIKKARGKEGSRREGSRREGNRREGKRNNLLTDVKRAQYHVPFICWVPVTGQEQGSIGENG